MIRINLLEEQRKAPTKSRELNLGGSSGIVAVAMIALAVLFVGYKSFSLGSQQKSLQREVAAADAELKELQDALKLIDTHKAKKEALNRQVELISELKRRQQVPVHLLDQLSTELPDFLWLEGLEETGGKVKIRGRATTYNAVSNFYNNLNNSPFFSDVSLGNTQRVTEGVSFSLSCRFKTVEQTADSEEGMAEARG